MDEKEYLTKRIKGLKRLYSLKCSRIVINTNIKNINRELFLLDKVLLNGF